MKPLNDRTQAVLETLVKRYITAGEPVGSKMLAKDLSIMLSPATIRNVMADLEDAGYIYSPHPSAGRIPTPKAYRFYVNSILSQPSKLEDSLALNAGSLNSQQNIRAIMQNTSSLLTEMTKMTAIVTLPKLQQLTLRHIEFIPLASNRILTVLVLNEQDVQNRIIETPRTFSESELQHISNYLNQHYVGKDLRTIQQLLFADMEQDKHSLDTLLSLITEMGEQPLHHEEVCMAGQANLLNNLPQENLSKLRALFEIFNEKQQILSMLERCVHAQGVQIFIGEEAGHDIFQELSLVTSSYTLAGSIVGVVGVIGPTRMPYEKVIPIVDVTARLLSEAISGKKTLE